MLHLSVSLWGSLPRCSLHSGGHRASAQIDRTAATLERLRRTNVYNDAFHIWHDGQFGTISGFRMGRTSQARGTPIRITRMGRTWQARGTMHNEHTWAARCGRWLSRAIDTHGPHVAGAGHLAKECG